MKIRGQISRLFIITIASLVVTLILSISLYLYFGTKRDLKNIKTTEINKVKNNLHNYVDIAYETVKSTYEEATSVEHIKKVYGQELKNSVDLAVSQVVKLVDLSESGKLSQKVAQDRAKEIIREMRYNDGKGYFWINDISTPYPKMVMHPIAPQLNGKIMNADKYNCALGKGINLFVAMRDICLENGSGFVDYVWPKPGVDKAVGKLSYVKLIKDWGWIIGTGVYVDDAQQDAIASIKYNLSIMRYNDGKGYFWINDISTPYPKMVMHPIAPQLDGKVMNADKYNCALGKGENLFVAMRDVCLKDGSGFVDYVWPKPGKDSAYAKLSYIKLYKPLGWIIGTGVYLDDVNKTIMVSKQKELKKAKTLFVIILISSLILVVISLLFFYKILGKMIISPLTHAVEASRNIALGDLSIKLDESRDDEIGVLNRSFNTMVKGLKDKVNIANNMAEGDLSEIIRPTSDKDILGISLKKMTESLLKIIAKVQETTEVVSKNSEELITSSEGLSMGASQQAAAIEEITSTTAEISTQANNNLVNSRKTAELYHKIKEGLDISNKELEDMMGAMNNIEESSKKISTIIKTVDDIAFQTNLLALNAAVEAARAGQHGKGFAVVADEVRNLAQRSAKAAQETTELIDGSIKAVNNGKVISEKSVEAINKMGEDIIKVDDIIKELEESSATQSEGVKQINAGLDQINTVAEHTVVNVDNTTQMSHELAYHAKNLVEIVSYFKVDPELACVVSSTEKVTPELIINKVREFAKEIEIKGDKAFHKLYEVGSNYIFGGTYIFVQNLQGVMLAHPVKQELIGKDLNNIKDIKDTFFFREMNETARNLGEGWVTYYWPKPGEDEPSLKTTFVKRVPGTDFVVACGAYDIEPQKSIGYKE